MVGTSERSFEIYSLYSSSSEKDLSHSHLSIPITVCLQLRARHDNEPKKGYRQAIRVLQRLQSMFNTAK